MTLKLCILFSHFCIFHVLFQNVVFAGFTTTRFGRQPLWNSTYTDKLRQGLLLNYDKFSRPAQHTNVTTVRFGLKFKHIEVNEYKFSVTAHALAQMEWIDEKLKWRPANYGGLKSLQFAEHEIWQPDITLENSISMGAPNNNFGRTNLILTPDGNVLWVPPVQLTFLCSFDFKYWPFDEQTCQMIFISWTHDGDQIDIETRWNATTANLDYAINNTEWYIVETRMKRAIKTFDCCEQTFPRIEVDITVRRKTSAYHAILIAPIFAIIVLCLLTFWLPPQAGEKIVLNGCTILLICLFLLYFSQKVPVMGDRTSLIVLFYSSAMHVTALSTVVSVFVIWLSRTRHSAGLPWIIKSNLTGKFGTYLGLQKYISQLRPDHALHRVPTEEAGDHQNSNMEEHDLDDHRVFKIRKTAIQEEWVLLAAAIDKLAFGFYSLIFLFLMMIDSV